MRKLLLSIACATALWSAPARADLDVLDGNAAAQVIFDFTCFTTKHCTAHVPINSAGTEIFTAADPGLISGTGSAGSAATGVVTVQGIASMTPLLSTISQGGNSATVATAGADGVTNSTVGLNTYANLRVYNGSTWDRVPGNLTDGMSVKVTSSVGVANDAAPSSGAPVGGVGRSAEPTALTNGRFGFALMDLQTRLIMFPYTLKENLLAGLISTSMTGTTSTAVTGMGAPGSGLHNYITTISCSNAHASVGTDIDLQDGSGGSTFWIVPAAAVYGGAVLSLTAPVKQPTSNTALYAKNVTTGASTRCAFAGFKGS